MTTSTTSVTSEQRKQCMQIADDAVRRAFHEVPLDRESIQRFIENSEKFQACIIDCVRDLSLSNRFANEEIGSNYTYPEGYNAHPTLEENIQDLGEELKILRAFFPELKNSDFDRHFGYRIRMGDVVLPEGAERWTLIPLWSKIASHDKAVTKVLDIIEPGHDHARTGEGYLRRQARTEKMLRILREEQHNNDILLVPVQFGLRHRGRSVRRAREVFADNEFGLGTFEVGIMLLTHPEREVQMEQLDVDCAGDEYNEKVELNDGYSRRAMFYFRDGKIRSDSELLKTACSYNGSVSAFLLK